MAPRPRKTAPAKTGKAAAKPPAADAPRAPLPDRLDPVVVVPVKTLPPGRWLHECKLDGYRVLARIDANGVRLFARNQADWTSRLPALATALKKLPRGTWLDGVVTGDDTNTRTADYAGLSDAGDDAVYHVFDAPYLADEDLRLTSLDARKEKLRDAVAKLHAPRVRLVEPVGTANDDDKAMLAHACARGLEGIVSKDRDSAYFGMRSGTWVKRSCIQQESFLVLGIAPNQGTAKGFAIHVGHRSIGGLIIYDGLVSDGFSDEAIRRIEAHVAKHTAPTPELFLATGRKVAPKKYAGGVWGVPELVVEASFVRRVAGLLREGKFKGFRADMTAAELVR
ncbi:hypothetical protein [Roseiterribacter gracilis]|uniref:ATP-dependent DNA ligase family profile domain-containing protein n=1 Tax=Roseiterribacter gracilis TaxID=2812848 RepID=A0A8S8X8J2_9PROT|nr:hypothetical protein TMPK1_03880 [Rhodospirillales bacterium TMPK1]